MLPRLGPWSTRLRYPIERAVYTAASMSRLTSMKLSVFTRLPDWRVLIPSTPYPLAASPLARGPLGLPWNDSPLPCTLTTRGRENTGRVPGCQSAASTREPSIALMARKRKLVPAGASYSAGTSAGRVINSYSMPAARSAIATSILPKVMQNATNPCEIHDFMMRPLFSLVEAPEQYSPVQNGGRRGARVPACRAGHA